MSFESPPPPSAPAPTQPHPPVPLEPSSSSSSSVPSLTSSESSSADSSADSDALASPLRRLSLLDEHSPQATRKPDAQEPVSFHEDSAIHIADSTDAHEQGTRENMRDREFRQERRSVGREVDFNMSRDAPLPLPLPLPSPLSPSPRPPIPHRTSSYTKRHSSFDTPREIPLPYMPHREPPYASSSGSSTQGSSAAHDSKPTQRLSCLVSSTFDFDPRVDSARSVFDENAGSSSSDSSPSASSSSSPPTSMAGPSKAARVSNPDMMDVTESSPSSSSSTHYRTSLSSQHTRSQSPRIPPSSTSMLPLFSRPFSSPDASRPIVSPRPLRPSGVPDRGSTASLPLDTPLHTLPAFVGGTIEEDEEMRSAAPTRPSSSRPTGATNQVTTSSIPSSSSWQTRRSPSLASDLEHEEFMSLVANRILDRASSIISDRPLPPPAPPTVLTPPPPPSAQDSEQTAPYKPFLAHAPPPQESFIAVDTTPAEYRLLVRLPGFRRDAITVSTRKRRILHVVADSWEPNGGHFEQRISFGYDALLAQVRAEFDGEHLQVIVPRRAVPMTY